MAVKAAVEIKAPNMKEAVFKINGTAPLVVHRFSIKTKQEMQLKMETGKAGGNRKIREPKNSDDTFNEGRYISKAGWDGFHAAALRNAMIRACSLVGFTMTMAKMSVFVVADGWDAKEPQIPLVRIYGKATKQEDMARVETGQPYVTIRPAYYEWSANVRIKWDADQFTLSDITNLLMRVGLQVGLCEGRPSSKNSAGMGWGLFEIEQAGDKK
jgi:hypothetical protein